MVSIFSREDGDSMSRRQNPEGHRHPHRPENSLSSSENFKTKNNAGAQQNAIKIMHEGYALIKMQNLEHSISYF
jgi:hypothetical protein